MRSGEKYLWLGDNGDGTWAGKFTIPETHGQLLATVLEKLSGPRRHGRTRSGEPVVDATVPGPGERLSYVEVLGAALTELIEHLPETGHTRSGLSLVVNGEEADLRTGTGAATLESGGRISAWQARRLACEAGFLPLVMGSASVPLDLGTTTRLFTRAQADVPWSEHQVAA